MSKELSGMEREEMNRRLEGFLADMILYQVQQVPLGQVAARVASMVDPECDLEESLVLPHALRSMTTLPHHWHWMFKAVMGRLEFELRRVFCVERDGLETLGFVRERIVSGLDSMGFVAQMSENGPMLSICFVKGPCLCLGVDYVGDGDFVLSFPDGAKDTCSPFTLVQALVHIIRKHLTAQWGPELRMLAVENPAPVYASFEARRFNANP